MASEKSGFHREVISHPLNWHEKVETGKKYEDAEEARLMYVASTRARNLMVISTYEENLKYKSWNFLDNSLNQVPELEFDRGAEEEEEKEREKLSLHKNEWENAQKQIHKRKENVEDSTYTVETVTNIAKSEAPIPSWAQRGKGESWGRAVHALLELWKW